MKTGVYILQFIPPGGGGKKHDFFKLGGKNMAFERKKILQTFSFFKRKGGKH